MAYKSHSVLMSSLQFGHLDIEIFLLFLLSLEFLLAKWFDGRCCKKFQFQHCHAEYHTILFIPFKWRTLFGDYCGMFKGMSVFKYGQHFAFDVRSEHSLSGLWEMVVAAQCFINGIFYNIHKKINMGKSLE